MLLRFIDVPPFLSDISPDERAIDRVKWRREPTGLAGDWAASKRAGSGRPHVPMSISLAASRARPSVIATKNALFAFLAIFGNRPSDGAQANW